jgi:hypothetical protein
MGGDGIGGDQRGNFPYGLEVGTSISHLKASLGYRVVDMPSDSHRHYDTDDDWLAGGKEEEETKAPQN